MRYNTKNNKVRKAKPTAINKMGEAAYKLDPREELVATILTTFMNKSYYESEKTIVNRLKAAMDKCDPLFVAKLGVYARTKANMRTSSHFIAGELADKGSGTEWLKNFYRKIVVRPDDISEILSYYMTFKAKSSGRASRGVKAMPNAMRKGFRAAMENFDAYQIDKYKMKGKALSMIDLVRLLHPVTNQKNRTAYKYLMEGKSLDGLYHSTILEKELSKAGNKKNVAKAKKKAYEKVIGKNIKGMPVMNLIMNLRNIITDAPDSVVEAATQLTNPKIIANSRLLPFQFATAYQEVSKMLVGLKPTSKVTFEKDAKQPKAKLIKLVLSALEVAIELACQNIPKLDGNTAILVDHSGSMRQGFISTRPPNTLSDALGTNKAQIGNLFANMVASQQDNIFYGLFGDRLVQANYKRKKGLLKNHVNTMEAGVACGGRTERGLYTFLQTVIDESQRIDNLIIFSDMVIGSGYSAQWDMTSGLARGTFQELFKKFLKVNPHCKIVVVNLDQTSGTSVFDKSLKITQIAGWSDKIFDHIGSAVNGYADLIKEIESIKL